MDPDDADLLRRYVAERDDAAFSELVRRHLDLVYGAALRQVGGDAHRAKDVAQNVFTLLARKSGSLVRHEALAGWLHTTTRFAAKDAMRAEQRRVFREQESQRLTDMSESSEAGDLWERLRPVIDAALGELNEADRQAVLMRFFAGLPFAEVGAKLSITENTARMRVERALDRLQILLAKRGVTSTAGAVAVALGSQPAVAMPVGLASAVTGAALAMGPGAGATAVISFMSVSKLTVGIAGIAALVASIGLFWQVRANSQLRDEVAMLRQQSATMARLQAENNRLAQARSQQAEEMTRLRTQVSRLADLLPVTDNGSGVGGGRTGSATMAGAAEAEAERGAIVQGASLEGRYARLFKQLSLGGKEAAKFKGLLEAKQAAAEDAVAALLQQGVDVNAKMPMVRDAVALAQAPINAQIQNEIGEAAYTRYRRYEDTLPQRNTIEQLEQMLNPTSTPLTPEQAEQMVDLLEKTHEPEGKGGTGRLLDGNMNYHSKISAVTITRSGDVLSVPQVEMLKNLQQFQRGRSGR